MIVLRDARKSDLKEIVMLGLEILRKEKKYEPLLDVSGSGKNGYALWLRKCFKSKKFRFFVAEKDGKLAGMCFGQHEDAPAFQPKTTGYLWHIIVRKGFRKQGIGRALLMKLEQSVKESRIKYIELDVAYADKSLLKIWHSLGYKPSWLRMRKQL